ncbi:MAG TPA: response regulator [Candidatus Sulfotelmatobacter sp.]|nr:response regulator [Candidatus Sulfotelmatobacter sp.]
MNSFEKVNILLVDDQPGKLLSYEATLGELGENLIKASSAKEALEHLLKNDIALVLVDVCMPDLDGFELASMIREHPRFARIAIIFVSAIQITELDRLRGYQAGAVDYVPVPVVPELLRAKVKVFAELYRKTRQLETLNAELERRVAERTVDLERANLELEQRVEERTQEREAALAQLHEMQKLESLGQLTGGVAHDFNNVLAAVLGNLDVLSRRPSDDPEARRFIDGAMKAAERGAALTRRMLAFARRQELKPEAVDVAQLVGGMTEMLRRSLGPTIQIVAEFQPGLAPTRVDPNQLELALLNLSLNARDAMPDGGRLTIAARAETASSGMRGLPAGSYVCIAVTDTGVGMDEMTLKRATEPFFTTKGVGKGTGLGLSMVHGFAAQSGGVARIASRLGAGTTIELWLPVAESAVAVRPAPAKPPAPARVQGREILLVDDDPLVIASTTAMLEDLGHAVMQATSAIGALTMLRSAAKVDLVITDHAMPGLTGTELARLIRQTWPSLPIILVTGYPELPKGEDQGLPWLTKPYQRDELAARIDAVLLDTAATPAAHNVVAVEFPRRA